MKGTAIHANRRFIPAACRLSVIALGLSLWLTPVEGWARPPRARERQCVIRTIEHNARAMTLRCGKDAEPLQFV